MHFSSIAGCLKSSMWTLLNWSPNETGTLEQHAYSTNKSCQSTKAQRQQPYNQESRKQCFNGCSHAGMPNKESITTSNCHQQCIHSLHNLMPCSLTKAVRCPDPPVNITRHLPKHTHTHSPYHPCPKHGKKGHKQNMLTALIAHGSNTDSTWPQHVHVPTSFTCRKVVHANMPAAGA